MILKDKQETYRPIVWKLADKQSDLIVLYHGDNQKELARQLKDAEEYKKNNAQLNGAWL